MPFESTEIVSRAKTIAVSTGASDNFCGYIVLHAFLASDKNPARIIEIVLLGEA